MSRQLSPENDQFQPPRRRRTFPAAVSATGGNSQGPGPAVPAFPEPSQYAGRYQRRPPTHGPWDAPMLPLPPDQVPAYLYSWYPSPGYPGILPPQPGGPYGVPPGYMPMPYGRPSSPTMLGRSRERRSSPPSQSHRSFHRRKTARFSSAGDSDDWDGTEDEDESVDIDIRREDDASPERYPTRVDYEDYESSTVYSFQPSRRASRASPSHSGSVEKPASADPAEPNEEGRPGVGDTPSGSIPRSIPTHVLESRYVGDSIYGGFHSVKLSVSESATVKAEPLFRWYHLEATVMDFDTFSKRVMGIERLSNVERNTIAKLLSRVRRDCLRGFQSSDSKDRYKMEPSCIKETLPPDPKYKGLEPRNVIWACLPHLSLEKYSGLHADQGSGMGAACPTPTLLQRQQPHISKQRDLEQVISAEKDNRRSERCLHVSQVWCIVVANSYLITYSRMPVRALCGDLIKKEDMSVDPRGSVIEKPKITVQFGSAVLWSIPRDECQTWFGLISRFREFWPHRLELFHHKRKILAADWPSIWSRARHTMIRLDFKIGSPARSAPRGRLGPRPTSTRETHPETELAPGGATTASSTQQGGKNTGNKVGLQPAQSATSGAKTAPVSTPKPSDEFSQSASKAATFSIFTCLDGVSRPGSLSIDETVLRDHLHDIEDFLLHETSYSDQRAYKWCGESDYDSVRSVLETRGAELSSQSADRPDAQRAQAEYEDKIDVFNSADSLFHFFIPANFEGPTVRKFWGAIMDILSFEPKLASNNILNSLRSELRRLATDLTSFQELFSQAQPSDRGRIQVPYEMQSALVHLILGFVHARRASMRSERFIDGAIHLLGEGMNMIVKSLSDRPLLEDSAIAPLEIFSLLSLNLTQGFTVFDGAGRPGPADERKSRVREIAPIYRNHLEKLEGVIDNKPSNRENERLINRVAEEIDAIRKIVLRQRDVFRELQMFHDQETKNTIGRELEPTTIIAGRRESATKSRVRTSSPTRHASHVGKSHYRQAPETVVRTYRDEEISGHYAPTYVQPSQAPNYDNVIITAESDDYKLPSTDLGGYRNLFLGEVSHNIGQEQDEYDDLRYFANALKIRNRDKLDTTKFRQENAIYAFTIVTIIFLPLSAIASIFGMNTTDIRDLEAGQWLYWATAVPVTGATVFLGLWWTGELRNFALWVLSKMQAKLGLDIISTAAAGAGASGRSPKVLMVERRRDDDYYGTGLSPRYPPPPPPPPRPVVMTGSRSRRREYDEESDARYY